MGPIDYVIVEFPRSNFTGEALPLLVDLVDQGIIRILDLLFVAKEDDGSVVVMDIADFDGDGTLDLAIFEGAASGMLDNEGSKLGTEMLDNQLSTQMTGLPGGSVETFVLMMIIADETDAAAEAKWQSYRDGVDEDAVKWLKAQSAPKDAAFL